MADRPRAVVVVECYPEDLPEVIGTCQGSLGPEYKATFHAAIDEDARMVLDVFVPAGHGAGKHTLIISSDEQHPGSFYWSLEHSLACRRAGLSDCTIHEALRDEHPDWRGTGRFDISLTDFGLHIQPEET